MKVVDIYSGAGGASLGVKLAGHDVVAAIDNDLAACQTYNKNLNLFPILGDIRQINGRHILYHFGIEPGCVDLVIGCPPCQGFSSLRKTTHPDGQDQRNDLVEVFLDRVEEMGARAVLFENVVGMSRGIGKEHLDGLIRRLNVMGFATNAEYIINAANYGVPQHRKRIVVFGVKGAAIPPKLPEGNYGANGESGKNYWRTVEYAIGDMPPLEAGERHPTIPNHKARLHTPELMRVIESIPKNGGGRKDLPRELWLPCHLRLDHKGAESVYGRMKWNAPSNTITCRCTTVSSGRFIHPDQDRTITVREAARLQTFPDTFVFPDFFSASERLVGNAVPPELMKILIEYAAEVTGF